MSDKLQFVVEFRRPRMQELFKKYGDRDWRSVDKLKFVGQL